MTGRSWEDQHAMRDVPIPGASAWDDAIAAGSCPICATGQTHVGSRCPDARRRVTTVGYQETAAEVVALVAVLLAAT